MSSSSAVDRLGGLLDFASGFSYLRSKSKPQLVKENWETILQWYKDKGFEWVLQVPPNLLEGTNYKVPGFSPFKLFKGRESPTIQFYTKAIPELNDTPIPNALDEIMNILKEEDAPEKIALEFDNPNENSILSTNTNNITQEYKKASTASNSPSNSSFGIFRLFKSSKTSIMSPRERPFLIELLKKADFFTLLIIMADFNIPVGMHSKVLDVIRYMLEHIVSAHSVLLDEPHGRKQLKYLLSNTFNTILTLRQQSKNLASQFELEICFIHLIDVIVTLLKNAPNYIDVFQVSEELLYLPKPFLVLCPLIAYLLDFISKENERSFLARDVLVKAAFIISFRPSFIQTDFPQRLMAPLLSKVVDETTYFAFLSKFCFSLENTLLSDALASILPLSSSFFNVKPIHPALVYKLHQMVLNLLGSLELSFKSQKVQFPIVPKHSKEPIFCMKSFLSQFLKGPRDDLENFLFDLNLEEKLEAPNTSSADSVEVPFSTLLSLWGANIDSVLAQSLFNFWKLFIINAPYNWVEWFLLGPGKSLVLERASFISFPNPAIAQTIQCEIGLILYAKYTFHSTLTRCKAFLISDQFKLFSKSD